MKTLTITSVNVPNLDLIEGNQLFVMKTECFSPFPFPPHLVVLALAWIRLSGTYTADSRGERESIGENCVASPHYADRSKLIHEVGCGAAFAASYALIRHRKVSHCAVGEGDVLAFAVAE
jgi:hypothetical protein